MEITEPSLKRLRIRSSTGSIFSASASLSTCNSAIKAACGPPKPLKAPPGISLVYTAYASVATLGISYGPLAKSVALPNTLVEV